MADEIAQVGIVDNTSRSDDKNSDNLSCIIQVIFDQHLQVDVETTGGSIFENVYVRPYNEFVYLNKEHYSGSEGVKGTTLVPMNQIASIRFREDRDYLLTERR